MVLAPHCVLIVPEECNFIADYKCLLASPPKGKQNTAWMTSNPHTSAYSSYTRPVGSVSRRITEWQWYISFSRSGRPSARWSKRNAALADDASVFALVASGQHVHLAAYQFGDGMRECESL